VACNEGNDFLIPFYKNIMGSGRENFQAGGREPSLHLPSLVSRGKDIQSTTNDQSGVRDLRKVMVDRMGIQFLE
jgi:hypothetical protein